MLYKLNQIGKQIARRVDKHATKRFRVLIHKTPKKIPATEVTGIEYPIAPAMKDADLNFLA